METKEKATENKICPFEEAINTISGKWKIPIIWQMNEEKKHPSEFLRSIAIVDRRVLNQQLKKMEQDGLISKIVFNELPPRVEYSLTELGKELVAVLWALNSWGELLLENRNEEY